jgi:mannosyl-oligosaccharide alpha-1,2-mannosidase
MLFISPERNLTYLTDIRGGIPNHRLEHLSCFFPGLLSLGIETLTAESTHPDSRHPVELPFVMKDLHFLAAEGLAETCYLMYADNPTGLSNEEIYFVSPLLASLSLGAVE